MMDITMYSYQQTRQVVLAIIAVFLVIFAGCTAPSETNVSIEETHLPIPQAYETTTVDQTTVISSNNIRKDPVFNGTKSPEPFFTFNTRSTIDSDGNVRLSEYQAWLLAEDYLETSKNILNITPEEVTARGPKMVIDKDANQTMIWIFEIHRKDSIGFERGGIIAINAYNGEILWYAGFT